MVTLRRFFNIAFIIVISWPCPLMAAEAAPPAQFKGIYEATFAGIPVGRMGIEVAQESVHTAITCDIVTTGLLNMFVHHKSHSTVDMVNGNGDYKTHYQTRKKKHYIKFGYTNGVMVSEEQIPPDPHTKRPEVPMAMKKDAANPVNFLLRLREETWKATHGGSDHFTINVYDGNRLIEGNFILKGKKNIRYNNLPIPAVIVEGHRKPLAGYTKDELADFSPHEPPLYIYFSDDTRMIPLKVDVALPFGSLSATLMKECRTGESCLLGLKGE